ncbi:hypothetical protein [Coleofasciculus sp. F4-SAH-05]|uniref:hypothetical protein n=1 Tax=Coleofasciculus sp. F4-SAH-05 TaxID=3069525 RepID=UPI0032F36897
MKGNLTSPDWAAQFRRNILAHGTFYKAPYFLMVFLDRFYLWTSIWIKALIDMGVSFVQQVLNIQLFQDDSGCILVW